MNDAHLTRKNDEILKFFEYYEGREDAKMILDRQIYLEKFKRYKDIIKVIIGVRRCGDLYCLSIFMLTI